MHIPQQVSFRKAAGTLAASLLILSTILYYVWAAAPSSTFWLAPGIYPGAPEVTVWREGNTYFAKNANGELIEGSGSTNSCYVIVQSLAALTAARTWKERVLLKGNIIIDLATNGALRIGILLDSYTILQIDGKLKLTDTPNTVVGIQNYIIRVDDNSEFVDIVGGEVDGNKAHHTATHYVYGIEVGNSFNIHVTGMYVHDTSETGIAFEGTTNRAWATFNYVADTDEDGIGNQYTANNIVYTGNKVEGCRTPGGGIFVEGGMGISVSDNVCYNNTNGIYVTRGTEVALIGVMVSNNMVYNNTYGIHLEQFVANVIVSNNVVKWNLGDGIFVGINATHNAIVGNQVFENDAADDDHSGIVLAENATFILVVNNIAYDGLTPQTQDWGISELTGANFNTISDCNTWTNAVGGILVLGDNTTVTTSWNNTVWILTS